MKTQYVKDKLKEHKAAYGIIRALNDIQTEFTKVIRDCNKKAIRATSEISKVEAYKKSLIARILNNPLT